MRLQNHLETRSFFDTVTVGCARTAVKYVHAILRSLDDRNVFVTDDAVTVHATVDIAERFPSLERALGVVVADGIGIRVNVRNGELHISDGVGRFRREAIFSRVDPPTRLVVVGRAGSITLEALTWLRNVGAGFVHLDRNGSPLGASIPAGRNDARIRRAQALAADNATGVEVARYLLMQKIEGQLDVARSLTVDTEPLGLIEQQIRAINEAEGLATLMVAESIAAGAYWICWAGLKPRFVTKDRSRVPAHWKRFTTRRSLVSGTPRLASDPINALLNFVYGLLETEARFACVAVGCDPFLGIVHKDAPNRASFALDLMEAGRPAVDRYILRLIEQPLRLGDFLEMQDGVCRIRPPLSHYLAQTMAMWATTLAPIAERAAAMFAKESRTTVARLSTPLTQANRRKARGSGHGQSASRRSSTMLPPTACTSCGQILERGRLVCDVCLPARKQEIITDMLKRSNETLRGRMRSEDAKARQSATMRQRNRDVAAWNELNDAPPDFQMFEREILPGLQRVSVRVIARATALSSRYASMIRNGLKTPHRRHWETLRSLTEAET